MPLVMAFLVDEDIFFSLSVALPILVSPVNKV
jgi:hypothetical protein